MKATLSVNIWQIKDLDSTALFFESIPSFKDP